MWLSLLSDADEVLPKANGDWWVPGLFGLVGVLVGAGIALLGQKLSRDEERRERLREAWAEWCTALDEQRRSHEQVFDAIEVNGGTNADASLEFVHGVLAEARQAQLEAGHLAESAYLQARLRDPDQVRKGLAAKIRTGEPFEAMRREQEEAAAGSDFSLSRERFRELCGQRVSEIGKFVDAVEESIRIAYPWWRL